MTDKKTLHTLEIVSVTLEDSGQYAAYISNAVGAAYSSARLQVRGGYPEGLDRADPLPYQTWVQGPEVIAPVSRDSGGQKLALQGTALRLLLPEHGK